MKPSLLQRSLMRLIKTASAETITARELVKQAGSEGPIPELRSSLLGNTYTPHTPDAAAQEAHEKRVNLFQNAISPARQGSTLMAKLAPYLVGGGAVAGGMGGKGTARGAATGLGATAGGYGGAKLVDYLASGGYLGDNQVIQKIAPWLGLIGGGVAGGVSGDVIASKLLPKKKDEEERQEPANRHQALLAELQKHRTNSYPYFSRNPAA